MLNVEKDAIGREDELSLREVTQVFLLGQDLFMRGYCSTSG